MNQQKANKMGYSPVWQLILTMSLPAIFSMLIQALYNIVDSAYVARLGSDALTGVSLAFPIQTLLIAVGVGTGAGINSLISRRLGEGKHKEASYVADHGIMLSILSSIPFMLFGLFFAKPFVASFTQSAGVIAAGTDYLSIVAIFSFAPIIYITIEKTLQATGNMIFPMIIQLIGAILNIILDPILIFGYFGFPPMGAAGAAIATVASQIVSLILSFYVIMRKNQDIALSLKGFKFNKPIIKNIYAVGFPSIVMQSIGSVLTMGMNGILAGFSDMAVSVLGVYYKLQSFIFMPVFGLTSGLMPILGFNYGAKNKKRMMSAFKIGMVSAVVIMGLGTLLFTLVPDKLLAIFKEAGATAAPAEMLAIGIPAMRIISLCFIPAAISIIVSTMFQSAGQGKNSLIVSTLRQLVLILPMAFILSKFGLEYVWYAYPLAEVLSLTVCFALAYKFYKSHIQNLGKE